MCGSPKLIAACHVLHRLFLPRHPPCALSSLTIEFTRTQQRNNPCNIERSTFDIVHAKYQIISPHRSRQISNTYKYLKTLNTDSSLRKPPEDMLLSLVVIYLPNLFSCQKSLSGMHCCNRLSRPEAARAFLLKVQSPQSRDSTSSRHRLINRSEKVMVELSGIEPLTPCLQSRCSPN